MRWADFGPYVLPFVTGVPEPTLWLHARLASIEFCRRTLCDIRTLDHVKSDGSGIVELDLPPETQLIKVKAIEVDGRDHPVYDARRSLSVARRQSGEKFSYLLPDLTVRINPVPAKGIKVTGDAALAPSLTATELDDLVAQQYAQDIAHGIIQSLKELPKTDWSDPAGAELVGGKFKARIATVAAKVARGQMATKMPSYIGYV